MKTSTFRAALAVCLLLNICISFLAPFGRVSISPEVGRAISEQYGSLVPFPDPNMTVFFYIYSAIWVYGIVGLFLGWRFSRESFLLSSLLFLLESSARPVYFISGISYLVIICKNVLTTIMLCLAYAVPPNGFFSTSRSQAIAK